MLPSHTEEVALKIGWKKKKKNQQGDTIAYLLEWWKSRTLTASNADVNVEQQELLFTAGGTAKWYSHIERQVGSFSNKIKHTHYMTQQLCFLVLTQVNWKSMST